SMPMSAEIESHEVESIGVVAGVVWKYLSEHDPVTLSKLSREIDAPRDLVMQAVGWLGREGKIEFQKGARSKLISLTSE
ncbi:MAG: winged helix-turn-helix domain-containing protein, partial [Gimesia sp.]|nr:winged helix-turn-helix domain-containing protein [Gimesia sp.]